MFKIKLLVSLILLALAGTIGAQELGIKAKKPVFGGACKTCPWGAMAEVVKAAMQPYGYDVQVCYNCSGVDSTRIVAGAKMPPSIEEFWRRSPELRSQMPAPPAGPVDFGATASQFLWDAYRGKGAYKGEPAHSNLRLIAEIQSPTYLIVAARAELGITDLRQIKEKRWPVRIITSVGDQALQVLAYYGLTREAVESAGGHIGSGGSAAERKNFDIAIGEGSLVNAPEWNMWYEISQTFRLNYIELQDDLLTKFAKEQEMERVTLPLGLLRGVDRPIPTVAHTGTAVYARTDTPTDFAYAVAQALDEHQDLFQWSMQNFSYNSRAVWKAYGVPLHPGAERYYREMKYMK